MSAYDILQWVIVLAAVLLSALYMLGRLAPGWRGKLAAHLRQARQPRWMQVIGAKIGGASGCGSGCSSCDSCPSNQAKK